MEVFLEEETFELVLKVQRFAMGTGFLGREYHMSKSRMA